jgi:hypothetical protein
MSNGSDLDGEARFVNCVVRPDHIQSHDVRNNRLARGGRAADAAKGDGHHDDSDNRDLRE